MKEKILQIIRDLYCCEYTGLLKIEEIPNGYCLVLGLNNTEKPLRISANLDEENFLKFIRKELRERHLDFTKYYYGYQIMADPGCPIDQSCYCNV